VVCRKRGDRDDLEHAGARRAKAAVWRSDLGSSGEREKAMAMVDVATDDFVSNPLEAVVARSFLCRGFSAFTLFAEARLK